MKLQTVLSKSRIILFNTIRVVNSIVKYLRTWRKRRLYQQWIEKAGLPSEAIPKEEFAVDIIPKIDEKQPRLTLLYMLLGASLVILCGALVLLIVQSC